MHQSLLFYLFVVNDHSSSQRYGFTTDNYGSLFGPNVDIKSDSVSPQYTVSNLTLPPHGLQSILSATALQGSAATSAVSSTNSASLSMRSCMNSITTPTIYTIEDHGGGSPLINLIPSTVMSGVGGESEPPASTTTQQKKRKLSITECFPVGVHSVTANTNSPNVKQEPRNI